MSATWEKVTADVADRSARGWIDPGRATRLVRAMEERDVLGRERYGRPLVPFNGRDQLQDAFEEVLDCTAYLRTLLEEMDELHCQDHAREQVRRAYDDSLALCDCLMAIKSCRERNPE